MGGARETANLWWCLTHKYGWSRLWGKHSLWKSGYFWHDTFGVYFYRYIKCKLFEHQNIKDVSDNRNYVELHCFDCEQKVQPLPLFFGVEPAPPENSRPWEQRWFEGAAENTPEASRDPATPIGSIESQGVTFQGDLNNITFKDGEKEISVAQIEKSLRQAKWIAIVCLFIVLLLILHTVGELMGKLT